MQERNDFFNHLYRGIIAIADIKTRLAIESPFDARLLVYAPITSYFVHFALPLEYETFHGSTSSHNTR